ncbi:MAG: dicarboxylate/amino acid:cation symporter [Gemmatimonadota bacterium]
MTLRFEGGEGKAPRGSEEEPGGSGLQLGLGTRILLGMIVGAGAGVAFGQGTAVVEPLGDLFIRLLMMAAIPLVFFNLLAGLTALTDLRAFGRLSAKIVSYYLVTTAAALTLGLTAMLLVRPGVGMTLTGEVDEAIGAVPAVSDLLLQLVPTNVFQAFAEGNVAQLVVVAVFLGITTLFLPQEPRDVLRKGYAALAELFRKLVDGILWVAPFGIGALMAVTVGRHGAELFGPMARFLLGVWGTQLLMMTVYMILLVLLTDRRPWSFLRDTGPLWATTVATTSSLASLSVALEMAEKIKLPRSIYSFTLPLGAQINKDGTSIMLSAVLVFTAQAAGIDFTLMQMATILLVGLLLSEGSGGIPGGGLVIALIFVQAFNLPLEIAAIVGGIYRLVDMGNTTTNVMGDMVGTAIVSHSESRKLPPEAAA